MQIILMQSEIEEALTDYVLNKISINEDQQISIDLSAGRGPEGFKATIDIVTAEPEVVETINNALGIADKIAEAKGEAAPTQRRTRRTAAQIAADNAAIEADKAAEAEAARLLTAGEDAGEGEINQDFPLDAQVALIADEPTAEVLAEGVDQSQPAAEAEAEAEAEAATGEEAPAPRKSLFGGLTHPKADV